MKNNGIEDIYIDARSNTKSQNGKVFFVLFIIILIILAIFIGIYFYITKNTTISYKAEFSKKLANININQILNNDMYEEMYTKIVNEDSKITSNINYSTTTQKEKLEGIDVSKLNLSINNINDVTDNKSQTELSLDYSENEIFKAKILLAENKIGLYSDEILDKYIITNLDNVNNIFPNLKYNISSEKYNKFSKAQKRDLNNDELNSYIKKYYEKILNNVSDENFSIEENIAIEKDSSQIDVTSYNLSLTQDELKNILRIFLNELKNDKELINKICYDETIIKSNVTDELDSTDVVTDLEQNTNEEIENPDMQIEGVEQQHFETAYFGEDTNLDFNYDNLEENLNNNEDSIETLNGDHESEVIKSDSNTLKNEIKTRSANSNISIELIDILKLMLGQRLNLTKQEFEYKIDSLIQELNSLSGDGITINVFASEKNIEKIKFILPNQDILDIEFSNVLDEQNGIKFNYIDSEQTGYIFDFDKTQKSASQTIDAIFSFVEHGKINKKVNLNIKTNKSSNSFKNDIVISISTSEGEEKFIIENNISFNIETVNEVFTEENVLDLDVLSEEELNQNLENIKATINNLYNEKKKNFNFIDKNVHSSTIEIGTNRVFSNNVTIDEARQAVIDKVSRMMTDAMNNGEEFTIQNLNGLTIDGYEVSTNVDEEKAVVVVDVYTFNIDTNFTITDITN